MPYLAPGSLRDDADGACLPADPVVLQAELYRLGRRELMLPLNWTGGGLNRYACMCYCKANPQKYADKAKWWGAVFMAAVKSENVDLAAAAMEIYRRDIGPYEDVKAIENGDLPWPSFAPWEREEHEAS